MQASRKTGTVEDRVRAVVAEETGLRTEEVLYTSRLGPDLKIGIVLGRADFLALLYAIQEEFDITISRKYIPPDEKLSEITVHDICEVVKKILQTTR